jgi:hypothetical protein
MWLPNITLKLICFVIFDLLRTIIYLGKRHLEVVEFLFSINHNFGLTLAFTFFCFLLNVKESMYTNLTWRLCTLQIMHVANCH